MQGRTEIDAVGDCIVVRGGKWLDVTRIHQVAVGRDIDTQTGNTATVIVCFADFPFECRTAELLMKNISRKWRVFNQKPPYKERTLLTNQPIVFSLHQLLNGYYNIISKTLDKRKVIW